MDRTRPSQNPGLFITQQCLDFLEGCHKRKRTGEVCDLGIIELDSVEEALKGMELDVFPGHKESGVSLTKERSVAHLCSMHE